MQEVKLLTVEQFEFFKIFFDDNKSTMISEILLTLPVLDDIDMYDLAVECLNILADCTESFFFDLSNAMKNIILEEGVE